MKAAPRTRRSVSLQQEGLLQEARVFQASTAYAPYWALRQAALSGDASRTKPNSCSGNRKQLSDPGPPPAAAGSGHDVHRPAEPDNLPPNSPSVWTSRNPVLQDDDSRTTVRQFLQNTRQPPETGGCLDT